MNKVKKKVKTGKIPKPIKIKKEKTEEDRGLHPMSHYIDDRLELVKQIFGSLKPKTITNLAPDFLKKRSMDEIEELCLNELLGISTKRLLSIINATKCPSDTESSSDSDIEHQEEHISLEEISSDSEIEGSTSNAGKKKSAGHKGKTGIKKATKNSAENDENNGQISVLELLELQARARAIRSQLALEPVTKIEVDSDGEKNDVKSRIQKPSNGTDSRDHKHKSRRKSSEKIKEAAKEKTQLPPPSSNPKSSKPTTSSSAMNAPSTSNVKVKDTEGDLQSSKLKRNYRTKNVDDDENAKSKSDSIMTEVKREARSDSPTPDVIPIIPEPETLLITDSSDGENDGIEKKKSRKSETTKDNSIDATKTEVLAVNVDKEKPTRERKITEPEEGELVESQIEDEKETDEKTNQANQTDSNVATSSETANEMETTTTAPPEPEAGAEVKAAENAIKTECNKTDAAEKIPQTVVTANEDEKQIKSSTTDANLAPNLEEEDDRNDDVISLEGGDLEEEMIEHLEEDTSAKSSFATSSKKSNTVSEEQDSDIISLDSSEDEREKQSSESWHSRYLKSSKVSKVLATSRLGKRVRDNIKMSKRSKKDAERVKVPEEKGKPSTSYASKHEDGSVEQYKELLGMRQRKK